MTTVTDLSLTDIMDVILENPSFHAPSTKFFGVLEKISKDIFLNSGFTSPECKRCNAGRYGDIIFPFAQMGTVSSVDIFSSMNELIILTFYWANRDRYRRAADIGANIGLHTIMMSRLGWHVRAYEPDPVHLRQLRENSILNKLEHLEIVEAAVSDKDGTFEFVRVLGNTTSSHIEGSKAAPYGKLERFPVKVVDVRSVIPEVDFIKIDAEGQERMLIESTTSSNFDHMDMMVEIGSQKSAEAIFEHLSKIDVNAFSQKVGWRCVKSRSDMPDSYMDGSLFISKKENMPW